MFTSAKLASILLAIAASAQASVVARSELAELSVIFFDDVNFNGAAYAPDSPTPATCIDLPGDWLDRAESVKIGAGYTCSFFVRAGCEGTGTQLTGNVAALPNPPLYDNIESFLCTKI